MNKLNTKFRYLTYEIFLVGQTIDHISKINMSDRAIDSFHTEKAWDKKSEIQSIESRKNIGKKNRSGVEGKVVYLRGNVGCRVTHALDSRFSIVKKIHSKCLLVNSMLLLRWISGN